MSQRRLGNPVGEENSLERQTGNMSVVDIDEKNLKHGVLGLVIALVEIIKDTLKIQAVKRMEGGSLTEEEMERLGEALMDLDTAIDEIKQEQGITESVKSVRDGLDNLVDDVIDQFLNPKRWQKEIESSEKPSYTAR